jgi:hypothetical protein
MSFRKYLAAFFIMGMIFTAIPANATYAGDKPLVTKFQGEMHGNYAYSIGNSTYNGSIGQGGTYTANVNLYIPDNATIRFERVYVYWVWSTLGQKAIYPSLALEEAGRPGETIELKDRYVDSKGFVSSYDFFSGMDSYEVPGIETGTNNLTFKVTQTGQNGSSVSIHGLGLLVVYESPDEPERMIWVKEGADMLYSSYGITPEMATTAIDIEGKVPTDQISEARLFLVAPSGGYNRYDIPNKNMLLVNFIPDNQIPALMKTVFSILFPNFKGKTWVNFFDYNDTSQIGFDNRDIRPYLRADGNVAEVRDQGDYFQLTNAFITMTLKS